MVQYHNLLLIRAAELLIFTSLSTSQPVVGKYMVGNLWLVPSHRLQYKIPNQTNHKFPDYGEYEVK